MNLKNLINKYGLIFLLTLPVLILVAIRIVTPGSFKYDAKKWAEPSFAGSNIIDTSEIGSLPGRKLIVNLDNKITGLAGVQEEELFVPPDSILNRIYLGKIREHKGSVIIASSDLTLSARIWMVVSQTGIRDLYILTGNNDNEDFKNEFRSDTAVRPEF